ncbi:hypothetical protein EUTSA_v10028147mg, partial [Eutrema salsugineum]
ILSEKTKGKKVELKKKKIQKSKRKSEETNSSPVDGKLQKKRKAKAGNVEIVDHSQITPEANSNEKIKGKKRKLNKTKNKKKAEDKSSGHVDDDDDHLRQEVDKDKSFSEAVNAGIADNGTEIRNRKSKKSNKKKKLNSTSTKQNEKSSEKMNEIGEQEEDVYQISSGDEDCSRGMKKWVSDYYESRPSLDELQKRIDDFMTTHEERLEQEKQDREAKAAEGGWTVVVHHKGRKKSTEFESGTAVGSVSQAALENKIAKKKQSETVAHGFYRFQRREAQRNELLELQSKFEQDKKRIQQLRAARKFKPY